MRSWCLFLLMCSSLMAVDAPPVFSQAGKKDARAAFTRLGTDTPLTPQATPQLAGCYLWNGRADDKYRPFFQWELRLLGALTDTKGLKIRIVVLGPQRQSLNEGPWRELGTLAAKQRLDFDYRLNCPNPVAARIELAWTGGDSAFLVWDRVMVPLALADLADQGLPICIGGSFDDSKNKKNTVVTWNLWNIGGRPIAEGASVTVRCLADTGAMLRELTWKQPAGKPIAANACLPLSMSTERMIGVAGLALQANLPPPTTLIEVVEVDQQGRSLKAKLKNIAPTALIGALVTITLQGKDGAPVATVKLPALNVAVGAETVVTIADAPTVEWNTFTSRTDLPRR